MKKQGNRNHFLHLLGNKYESVYDHIYDKALW